MALVSVSTLSVLYGFVGPIANVEVSAITAAFAAFGLANLTAAVNSGDYFNNPENALIHLWSLGVEEQFYLVLPILLVFLWKFSPGRKPYWLLEISMWVICVLSFCFAIIPEREIFSSFILQSVFGFYSPVVRVWEFGFGVLSLLWSRRISVKGVSGELLGYIGFLLVGLSFFLVSSAWATPGLSTLIPVVGTAMVLIGGAGWLRWKPLVKIGDLSYSLYLWHWPLIFISGILFPNNFIAPLLSVIVSLFLSAITYRFVEVPFRQLGKNSSSRVVPRLIGISLIPVVLAFACLSFGDTYWRVIQQLRFTQPYEGELGNQAHFEATASSFHQCEDAEYAKHAPVRFDRTICFQSKPGVDASVVIIGDSHAEHLLAGFAQELPKHLTVAVVTNRFQGPVFASDEIDAIITALEADESVQIVVLAAWWEEANWRPAELTSFSERLIFSGKTIFLASDIHNFSFDANRCKYSNNLFWSSRTCSEPLLDRLGSKAKAVNWAEKNKIQVIDLHANLCAEECLMVSEGGVMLYRDWNHLTLSGSRVALANQLGDVKDHLENQADQRRVGW